MAVKIFGTDGVRGAANVHPITSDFALTLGKALAHIFRKDDSNNVIIGWDTRRSGHMLRSALAAGLTSRGMNVQLLPALPTPALAHHVRHSDACCGIMLTASHNPATDNGFKIFAPDGFKLDDELETEVERLVKAGVPEQSAVANEQLGEIRETTLQDCSYSDFLKAAGDLPDLSGIYAIVDCANGATSRIARDIFRDLGIDAVFHGAEPNGLNINEKCGAMHPEVAAALVNEHGAEVGISFDGDGDRVIFCDGDGTVINGDQILGLCAAELHANGQLKGDTLVVTVMSNLGLHDAMKERGIDVRVTPVGDRNVLECMEENGFNYGGEESGHIIFRDFATTGDGILSALQVLAIMKRSGKTLKELASFVELYPKRLVNLPTKSKIPLNEIDDFQAAFQEFEKQLGKTARHLVRYSGTENKIRILVEAKRQSDVDEWIDRLTAIAQKELC